jgi:hypothetical protein
VISTTPNFTVVVNWREKGFGCKKACSYCTWRDSALLPHGMQDLDTVSAFIAQCKKSFVTISGGADPLYRFDQYGEQFKAMARVVKESGYSVRVITREVDQVVRLKGIAQFVSISLDPEVLQEVERNQDRWDGLDMEYSLVLPPLPTEDIVALRQQYLALRKRLGRRLVLRENLNSIFPLDFDALSYGHSGIVFVPKKLCLSGRYLSTVDCLGYDIVQDNEGLAVHLMSDPRLHLFGGFVKHLLYPKVHLEYRDIDVIALDPGAMEDLKDKFGFSFTAISPPGSYPRYFIGKPKRAGKELHLVLMNSLADVSTFINNAQYDSDRVSFGGGRYHFDPRLDEARIRNAIAQKHATGVPRERHIPIFSRDRDLVEQRHRAKLLRKGYVVND